MKDVVQRLVLERIGDADATVGLISLPLPRELAPGISIDHPHAAMHPVAWWERNKLPRRSLAFVIDDHGVPERLALRCAAPPTAREPRASGWTVRPRLVSEHLPFKPPRFNNIASLRGVPAADCALLSK